VTLVEHDELFSAHDAPSASEVAFFNSHFEPEPTGHVFKLLNDGRRIHAHE
jgi:hypothetical protein